MLRVVKRDGRKKDFDLTKIQIAIGKAVKDVDPEFKFRSQVEYNKLAQSVASDIMDYVATQDDPTGIEKIQDLVEQKLMQAGYYDLAKSYILYRQKRSDFRQRNNSVNQLITESIANASTDSDERRENANVNADATMGAMLQIGSEATKNYFLKSIKPHHAQLHRDGAWHLNDLNFALLCLNCLMIPLGKVLRHGFFTGHGSVRQPSTINSAATLTCIIIQSNQNDMFGGQSIPALDYDLGLYVAKSYVRNCEEWLQTACKDFDPKAIEWRYKQFKEKFIKPMDEWLTDQGLYGRVMNQQGRWKIKELLANIAGLPQDIDDWIPEMFAWAEWKTDRDTHQAMESLIHNLCALSARAGAQVPFSSVNTGLDTSQEGRMVTKNLFLSEEEGLGNGETPIFPITIMKLKKGVTDPGSPNYDLFQLSCRVSAHRLLPNWVNMDAPFNLQYYRNDQPETHVASMGCRTRVIGNIYQPDKEITFGRGNLFMLNLSLPYLALELKEEQPELQGQELIDAYFDKVKYYMEEAFDSLLDRFEIVARRKVYNFPFLMGQGLYLDSEKLSPDDEIREVIKNGTLTVGFIGLSEALVALTGKHHGESPDSQELGLKIVGFMCDMCKAKALETKLNFSLMGSPAEGAAGRLLRCARKRFGVIEGVTDKEWFTNSHHVDVRYPISAWNKIHIEAPYHTLEPAG